MNATTQSRAVELTTRLHTTGQTVLKIIGEVVVTGAPVLIHRTRTTSRRLQSQLHLLSVLSGHPDCKKGIRQLSDLLKQPGKIRDLQVQELVFRGLSASVPSAAPLADYLKACGDRAFSRWLKEDPVKKAGKLITGTILHLTAGSRTEEKLTDIRLAGMVNQICRSVSHDLHTLNSKNVEALHRFRLKVKRYRYQLEALTLIFPVPSDLTDRLKHWQSGLGQLQDAEVSLAMLREHGLSAGLSAAEIRELHGVLYNHFTDLKNVVAAEVENGLSRAG